MGTLSPGDQDLYVWTVTEQDLQGRQVVFDLEGVPGGLTQAFNMRLTFAEDQITVTSRENLLTLSTLAGAKATTEPQLWTAGTYFFGLSASGGEGGYVLTAHIVDPRNPNIVDFEPNDSSAEAREQTGAFALSGSLQGSPDYHRWTLTEEDVVKLWKLSAQAMPGEELTVKLFKSTGELVLNGSVGDGARLTRLVFHDLGLEAGTYTLVLGPAAERLAPYILRADSQGVITEGHEIEPNNQRWEANHLDIKVGMTGTLGAHDRDNFRFRIDSESAGYYRLSLALEATAQLCLFDDLEVELFCQTGRTLGIPTLYLAEGDYLLVLDGNPQEAPYTLSFTATEAPAADYEIEPNNTLATATALGEDLAIRGELSGRERDVYTFSTTGEAQLFRVQVVGDGVESIRYYDGGGVLHQEMRNTSERRVRLDNLVLLPGEHYLEVRGENGTYLLKAISLGPTPLTGLPQEAVAGSTAGSEVDDIATVYPRPAGVLEREPNDDNSRAQLVRFGETYVGTLANLSDHDRYRFSLRNDAYVRVDAVPGAGGRLYMHVGRVRTEMLLGTESAVLERWLPAGDYFVSLHPVTASDDYYQLRVNLLNPFALPDDFEPNDSARQANPLPEHLQPAGVVGQHHDRDWYALPVFGDETLVTVSVLEGRLSELRLHDRETEERLPEEGRDYATQTYRFVIPAGLETALRVDGQSHYRLNVDFGEALVPQESELGVTAALELEQAELAAYWQGGQRLEAILNLENQTAQEKVLRLEAHTSDAGVRPEGFPEEITLIPHSNTAIPFTMMVMPDAADDQPVVLTLAARGEAGMVSAATTLQATCEAPPIGGFQSWPLPDALLGHFNVALLAFGTQVVETEDYLERDKELFDGRVSPATGPAHDVEQSIVIKLPGDGPFTLIGTILQPFGRGETANQLKDFELAVSLDGDHYETIFSGNLQALRQEQAFVFPEPARARYARLTLLSKQEAEAYGQLFLGEWKLVTAEPPLPHMNLADPQLGGYVVWSDPLLFIGNPILSEPQAGGVAALPRLQMPHDTSRAEWVIGFHHNRAAQIVRLEWVDHASSQEDRRFDSVEVFVSLDSPVGPWTPLASWVLAREPSSDETAIPTVAPLELETPVWARFVRFAVHGLTPRSLYDYPETIRVIEYPAAEDYPSILGEWGLYNHNASYEYLHPPAFQALSYDTDDNDTAETATLLEHSASGYVLLGEDQDWYKIEVPEGHNQLTLRLTGDPVIGYSYLLQDAAGSPVPAEVEVSLEEVVLTATVESGSYYLKLEEPLRSIVFSWDTSGSVGPYESLIYSSLARFATQVRPEREEVSLLAFDDPRPLFLLPDWTGDPHAVLSALSGFDRRVSSSSAEAALLGATRALFGREGAKAVLLITDAESSSYQVTPELWRTLASVKPRVFTFEVSSMGSDYSQDLMQSWAAVNHGVYSYTSNIGDFDMGFARATCQLRRPKGYTVSVSTSFVESGPGTLRVLQAERQSGGQQQTAIEHLALPAVEVIFDASGSMYKTLGGHYRYDIAKDVLARLVQERIPEGTPFALRVFGNREANSCRTDLELPLAPLDVAAVTGVITAIVPQPYAGTPLAASLRQVADDLRAASGPKTVILITDGEESCGGDVAAEIIALREQNIDVVINIVGFDVDAADKDAARAQFQAWAHLGGGQYYDANNAEELELSLQQSLALSFEILDETGLSIASGIVNGEEVQVPAGSYTVRVLSNPPQVFEGIRVSSHSSSTVTLQSGP